jgi:hypothetical protein
MKIFGFEIKKSASLTDTITVEAPVLTKSKVEILVAKEVLTYNVRPLSPYEIDKQVAAYEEEWKYMPHPIVEHYSHDLEKLTQIYRKMLESYGTAKQSDEEKREDAKFRNELAIKLFDIAENPEPNDSQDYNIEERNQEHRFNRIISVLNFLTKTRLNAHEMTTFYESTILEIADGLIKSRYYQLLTDFAQFYELDFKQNREKYLDALAIAIYTNVDRSLSLNRLINPDYEEKQFVFDKVAWMALGRGGFSDDPAIFYLLHKTQHSEDWNRFTNDGKPDTWNLLEPVLTHKLKNRLDLLLLLGAKENDLEVVKYLLESSDLKLHANIQMLNFAPFLAAISENNIEIVRYLYETTDVRLLNTLPIPPEIEHKSRTFWGLTRTPFLKTLASNPELSRLILIEFGMKLDPQLIAPHPDDDSYTMDAINELNIIINRRELHDNLMEDTIYSVVDDVEEQAPNWKI